MTTTYPSGTALPLQSTMLLEGIDPILRYTDSTREFKWRLLGGESPWPGIQDGIICTQWPRNMAAPFKHLDLQGAQQDGVTWTATVYDPPEIILPLEAHARTPQGISKVVSDWIASWNPVSNTTDPTQPLGTLEYITLDRGYWMCNPRLTKTWQDEIKLSPRRLLVQKITHACRIDQAFWASIPSASVFAPGGSGGTGFAPLTNIGDQPAWAAHVVYGPGIFGFGNGPASTSMITLGTETDPILDGQIVLVTTNPRLRSIVDVSPGQPTQTLTGSQQFLEQLINLVTNGNTIPLLQWFESLFGIAPPQGNLYALLNGRFTTPIPGVPQPSLAQTQYIPVSITGGNSNSKIVSTVTPLRRWPE